MRTLEDKITSANDSIQPVCDIANTFYWINYIYFHELRCECTPTCTEYTRSSASGTWSRVSLCYPCKQSTFTRALGEAASTHCPEILLLDKLIQMFWFTYFLHQHKSDKSWASISTRIKSYKILLST
jgi:hypothetical protein